MKKTILLLLILFLVTVSFAQKQETHISIKPFPHFIYKKIEMRQFDPVYGIEKKADVIPEKKGSFYDFKVYLDAPSVFTFTNEEGIGMGKTFFVKPGKNITALFFWTDAGELNVKLNDEADGENLFIQIINDSAGKADRMLKQNNYLNADSVYREKVGQTILILRNKYQLDPLFEKHILQPTIELQRAYFINLSLKQKEQTKRYVPYSIFSDPNYLFWSFGYLEYGWFKIFLTDSINAGNTNDLKLFVSQSLNFYSRRKDSLLNRIVVAQSLKAFYDNYIPDHLEAENIAIADKYIQDYNLNPGLLNLDNFFRVDRVILPQNTLNKLIFCPNELIKNISFQNILTDTSKIYFIDHWASWCKPCIESLPYSIALNEKYDNTVIPLFVSIDKDQKSYLLMKERMNLPSERSFQLQQNDENIDLYKSLNPVSVLPTYQLMVYRKGSWYVIKAASPESKYLDIQIERLKNLLH